MLSMEAMTISVEDLRSKLPIPYVLSVYGFEPASESPGRLHYRNPWRDDSHPSLDVFTDDKGVQRVGDYATGLNGSVLDVIGLQLGTDEFGEIIRVARELYSRYLEEGYEGPVVQGIDSSKGMDPGLVDEVLSARPVTRNHPIVVDMMQNNPGLSWDLLSQFDLRSYEGKIAMPYPDGKAIRFRHMDSKTFLAGSKPGLYHMPGLEISEYPKILLVEGETDTIAASDAMLGVPAVGVPGVGHQPTKYMDLLQDKTVYIAFDGDEAGRAGALRWEMALSAANCDVLLVPIPDGKDVAKMTQAEFRRVLRAARPAVKNTSGMIVTPSGYAIEGKKEGDIRHVCNWIVHPTRILEFDDGTPRAFEVRVTVAGGERHGTLLLTYDDMATGTKLHRWASQFSGSWWGSNTDHQRFRAVIEEQATFLPFDTATSKPGLVDGTFVYPGGTIGDASVVCVPNETFPFSDSHVFSFDIEEGVRPSSTIDKLLAMHQPEVTRPLLAWLAIAPLRSLYKQFPPLFVTGRAGSGKTTLVNEAVRTFSGIEFVTNLTSTTPYALTLTMGGTNAYVTWFDEYRPGARKGTMDMMDQLLRDAYNAAPSRRGGLDSDWSKITKIETSNPLLISGEDFADEQSHRDRLIKVFVPREGKGMLPLWTEDDEAFAYDYLLWLTERRDGIGEARAVVPPTITPVGEGLTERQAYNMGVLDAGWRLLRDYAFERHGKVLGDADWSTLLEVSQSESEDDPVIEGLRLLWESEGQSRAMWKTDDGAFLVNSGLVMPLLRDLGVVLPFSTWRAMSNYLLDLGATSTKRTTPMTGGQQLRYLRLEKPWPVE